MPIVNVDIEERETPEATRAAKEMFQPERLLQTLRDVLNFQALEALPADLSLEKGDFSDEQRQQYRNDLKEYQKAAPDEAPAAINVSWVTFKSEDEAFGEDNFTVRLNPEGTFVYVGAGVEI